MGNEYVVIKFQGKLTYEHRVVMENFIKRKLKKNEVVHHINGNKKDNRIENLIIMKLKKHNCFEANKKKVKQIRLNCPVCGQNFEKKPNVYRRNMKIGKGILFCSRKCTGLYYGKFNLKPRERRKQKGNLFRCGNCMKFKSRKEFYNKSNSWNKLSSYCKKCIKIKRGIGQVV